ncbi:hypothetical protein GQ42DRAFT_2334 [Ramicandelaber brevisporus]|nr:hypothetical protein GQ42DRAFT_2334 [Ramicandelaber brevisporus]
MARPTARVRMHTSKPGKSRKETDNATADNEDTSDSPKPAVASLSFEPYTPTFGGAFRILVLIRILAAFRSAHIGYPGDDGSSIETWEAAHFLSHGVGIQPDSYSGSERLASWTLPALFAGILSLLGKAISMHTKAYEFYIGRLILANISAYCEATLYDAVREHIDISVARYFIVAMGASAAMFDASVALSPQYVAMVASMLALAAFMRTPSYLSGLRMYRGLIFSSIAAMIGNPFAIIFGVLFGLEDVLLRGTEAFARIEIEQAIITPDWRQQRISRLARPFVLAASIAVPVVMVDSYFYGPRTIVALNVLVHHWQNLSLSPSSLVSSTLSLFGYHFAQSNLLFLLALLSLPLIGMTSFVLSQVTSTKSAENKDPTRATPTSPRVIIAIRSVPFYLWLILTALFARSPQQMREWSAVASPLICFNAAVGLYCTRFILDVIALVATRKYFAPTPKTTAAVVPSDLHAEIAAMIRFVTSNSAALLLTISVPLSLLRLSAQSANLHGVIDLYAHNLMNLNKEALALPLPLDENNHALCVGNKWSYFPGHYLAPNTYNVHFIGGPNEDAPADAASITPPVIWRVPSSASNTTKSDAQPSWLPDVFGVENLERCRTVIQQSVASTLSSPSKSDTSAATTIPTAECALILTTKTGEKRTWGNVIDHGDAINCRPVLNLNKATAWQKMMYKPLGKRDTLPDNWEEYCLVKPRNDAVILD